MYEAFYGLREKPFNLTPDPKYLYLSEKHKEAFAHLLFGIKNRSGFVMVTGEIGTGKTTICRNLLNQLDTETELAFIFNPSLNPVELLRKIVGEFGVASGADSILELTDALNAHLLGKAAEGKSCVLVIDEAQNLTPPVLEQIRLLSNLETETEKLLQIILIGQPELVEKLALKELRQLNQRITARYHLKPLGDNETLQYIAYRLHVAGGRKKVNFSRAAIRAVYKCSKGTPRVINALCDRALLIGYTKESHSITSAIVKRAAREIRGERIARRRTWPNAVRRWMPSPTLVLAAVLVLVLVQFFALPLRQAAQQLGVFNTFIGAETLPPVPAVEEPNTARAKVEGTGEQSEEVTRLLDQSAVARKVLERLTATVSAEEAVPEESFSDCLAGIAPEETRNAAASAILRRWNMALVGGYPDSDEVVSLTRFAEQHQLAYQHLTPAVEQLLAINLPAFVRLESGGRSLWLGLVGLEDDSFTLTTERGQTAVVSRGEFTGLYGGEAVLPWRDPTPAAPALLSGRQGALAGRFKEQLRRLGRLPAENTNNVYGMDTARAVARIQAETGLLIDGMAGRQVRMVLSSWLPDVETPGLGVLKDGSVPVKAAMRSASPTPTVVSSPPQNTPAPVPVPEEPLPAAEEPAPEPAVAPEIPVEAASAESVWEEPPLEETELPATAPEQDAPKAPPEAPPEEVRVHVQELSEPDAGVGLEPVDAESLKESTPPALGSPPLVPHVPEDS